MHAHIHACPPTDQIFGKIAGIFVKCLRLDTPLAFMKAILKGLGLIRSRGRGLHVDRLEKSRNWEARVADLDVAISGYTDPGSSHSTRLIRRKGASEGKQAHAFAIPCTPPLLFAPYAFSIRHSTITRTDTQATHACWQASTSTPIHIHAHRGTPTNMTDACIPTLTCSWCLHGTCFVPRFGHHSAR